MITPTRLTVEELRELSRLAESIGIDADWFGHRLVVEVWDRGDTRPVAWIEKHPDDSEPAIRFEAEL